MKTATYIQVHAHDELAVSGTAYNNTAGVYVVLKVGNVELYVRSADDLNRLSEEAARLADDMARKRLEVSA